METQPSGGSYATRADNFTYTAAGMISSMQLGNAKWENAVFNSRLQPIQLGLGNSNNTQELWKVNYDYGTTDNNGNVKSQTITAPSITAIVQNYTYDSLNRLKSATETVSSSTIWKQTFQYDRFGNRRFDTSGSNTTTIPGGCSTAQCNPTIDTVNNRFTTGQGYTYDLSGNLLTDAEGRTFVYDAENKQQTVSNSGGTIGTYYYDGDGKRVKKVSDIEITLFVYNVSSKMVAEYLLTEDTPSTPTTSYLTNDTLGSPRVITDSSGAVISRRDFMPFGEEISAIGGRTSGLGYQSDDTRQKFTSYERDNETDLDFAQARMYSNKLGRFATVDPLMASATASYAQSWNRYSYVGNNPLIYIDPTGKDYEDLQGKRKQLIDDYYAEEAKKQNKSVAEIYNALKDDQKLHYEGITNALEKTKVFDKNGKDTGKTVLDLVKSLDKSKLDSEGNLNAIRGLDSSGEGAESYRIFVTYESDAVKLLGDSNKNFDESGAGEHPGMEAGFREKGKPSIQSNYDPTKSFGDIDIDFRHGFWGKFAVGVTAGQAKIGALSVDNSNIGKNKEAYEKKYGKIPRKK